MPARAKADELTRIGRIGLAFVVLPLKLWPDRSAFRQAPVYQPGDESPFAAPVSPGSPNPSHRVNPKPRAH